VNSSLNLRPIARGWVNRRQHEPGFEDGASSALRGASTPALRAPAIVPNADDVVLFKESHRSNRKLGSFCQISTNHGGFVLPKQPNLLESQPSLREPRRSAAPTDGDVPSDQRTATKPSQRFPVSEWLDGRIYDRAIASLTSKNQHHYLAARCHRALVRTNKPPKPSAHTIGAPRDRA
jgi:hypothetical protein